MAERAGMGAKAEIALYQYWLRENGNGHGGEGCQESDGCADGVKPDDAGGGEDDFESVAQELSAQFGQATDLMNAVAALRHVGCEAALEVSVAEARDFGKESQTEAGFEMTAEAEET